MKPIKLFKTKEKKITKKDKENMLRGNFNTHFGLPRIMQSLSIEKKLDKETYQALHRELEELCERIIKMK